METMGGESAVEEKDLAREGDYALYKPVITEAASLA
jgi:hypothetical protein